METVLLGEAARGLEINLVVDRGEDVHPHQLGDEDVGLEAHLGREFLDDELRVLRIDRVGIFRFRGRGNGLPPGGRAPPGSAGAAAGGRRRRGRRAAGGGGVGGGSGGRLPDAFAKRVVAERRTIRISSCTCCTCSGVSVGGVLATRCIPGPAGARGAPCPWSSVPGLDRRFSFFSAFPFSRSKAASAAVRTVSGPVGIEAVDVDEVRQCPRPGCLRG
jgi:hypothetical protein